MQAMTSAELAHREAQRSTDPVVITTTIEKLEAVSKILDGNGLTNRAAHMLKLAKGLRRQLKKL